LTPDRANLLDLGADNLRRPGSAFGSLLKGFVDVKAASTVRADDFRGLRQVADRLGDDLLVGVVLYTGEQTLPFGPRFRAIPISALWET
jgi:hypothetical protein